MQQNDWQPLVRALVAMASLLSGSLCLVGGYVVRAMVTPAIAAAGNAGRADSVFLQSELIGRPLVTVGGGLVVAGVVLAVWAVIARRPTIAD